MSRLLKIFLWIVFSPNLFALGANLGHRAGGGDKEYFSDLPENSLIALRASLLGLKGREPIQDLEGFYYLEFDVQETLDNELVLFHDSDLLRVLPNDSVNRSAIERILSRVRERKRNPKLQYKDLKIQDLLLSEIKTLSLYKVRTERVPTLREFLEATHEWGLRKPLAAEVKYIYSDKARFEYLDLIEDFKKIHFSQQKPVIVEKYMLDPGGVTVYAFEKNFKKSFGDKFSRKRDFWCREMRSRGFDGAYRAMFFFDDLCKY